MLINTVEGQECRIAILDEGRLEELYTERTSSASQVGNIYKGKITNIEPSIQAAFIEFGGSKNGFLHISDVHPQYFPKSKNTEQVGKRSPHKTRPAIQGCLRRGQEIVVQMTKQGIGTKGPTMTTYLSIPGRLAVMMPDMTHVGISRKIEDEDTREKIRKILDQLEIPKDMGVIVRTAGIDRTKRELQRDVSYLSRLWTSVNRRIDSAKAPAEIYQESDLVIRTIRDVFDSDINRIICDNKSVALKVKEFLDLAVPRAKCKIELYAGSRGLFDEFHVEDEIQAIHSHRVEMKKGGSLVIDQAEALVAIDVNSGSFRAHHDAETNALELNLAAAEEIGRQLRLRDMGGVIIIDFVDLREDRNRRLLERKMKDILKKDRAKSKVLRISHFGIVEMTRQRLRPSLKQSIYSRCPHCDGTGLVMSHESVSLAVMRRLQVACAHEDVADIEVAVAPSVAHHLSNYQRGIITELENRTEKKIVISANDELSENDVKLICKNQRGATVAFEPPAKGKKTGESDIVDIKTLAGKRRERKSAPPEKTESQNQKKAAKDETKTQDDSAEKDEKDEKDGETGKTEKKSRRRGRRGGRRRRKKTDGATDNKTSENSENKDAEDASPIEENASPTEENKDTTPTEPPAAGQTEQTDQQTEAEQPAEDS